jgi:hypothetical protein
MDIERIAQAIGVPVEQWKGNCHGISELIVQRDALRGLGGPKTAYRVARGHYVGLVERDSYFGQRRGLPFIAHSWIQAHDLTYPLTEDAPWRIDREPPQIRLVHDPIIDPTRFAFDGKPPYIWIGANDGSYDEGGNSWREEHEPMLLPFDINAKPIKLRLPAVTEAWIAQQVMQHPNGGDYPYGYYTYALVMWLANLSLRRLGEHAEPIFRAIVDADHAAALPLDNRRKVLG